MEQVLKYRPVDDTLLQEMIQVILSVGHPLKIILFGSQANGQAKEDSDLDLLVVEEINLPRHQRASRYLRALTGLYPAKDVIVWTPEEILSWSGVSNAFITTILSEGKILYERP